MANPQLRLTPLSLSSHLVPSDSGSAAISPASPAYGISIPVITPPFPFELHTALRLVKRHPRSLRRSRRADVGDMGPSISVMSTAKRTFFDLFRPRGVNPLCPSPLSRTAPDRQFNILPLLRTPLHQPPTHHTPCFHCIHRTVFSQRVMNNVLVVMRLMVLVFFSIYSTSHHALKHPFQVLQQTSNRPQIIRISDRFTGLATFGAVPGSHLGVSRGLTGRFGSRGSGFWERSAAATPD